MIFNSQGDAKLRQFINGGTITPGPDPITLPKGGQLLGDLTIEAVDTDAAYEEGYNSGYAAGYAAGYEEGYAAGQAAALPYSKELQYIESTGTQYINTGFKANQDTSIYMDAQITDTGTSTLTLFGCRTSNTAMFMVYISNATMSARYNTGVVSKSTVRADRHNISLEKNKFSVDNESVSATYGSFQSAYNVYLFAVNNRDVIGYQASMKLYSCKIYDNGVLVRDFIPVLDKSGVACLYDKVGQQFYYNQGSGEFTYAA